MNIKLDGGKYTLKHDATGRLEALRFGAPWQDLTGNGLIYALAHKIEEYHETLLALSTNPHLNIDDAVYHVRESEGKGWEGPSVKAWGVAVEKAQKLIREWKEVNP